MAITQQEVFTENRRAHDAYATVHDRVASHIAKPGCRRFYRALLAEILSRHQAVVTGRHVLEVGCGTGNWAEYFLEANPAAYEGIDISAGMIEQAQEKLRHPKAQFRAVSVEDFASRVRGQQRYELLFSFSFIHHIYDLELFFRCVSDLLAPGGLYVTLHEPLVRDFASEKLNLGEILDSLLAALQGWDCPPRPLLQRVGQTWGMVTAKFRKPLESTSTHGTNLVDYQIGRGDFCPSTIQSVAHQQGLRCRVYLYSYYRSAWLRACFGSTKNYFAVVVHRTAQAGAASAP